MNPFSLLAIASLGAVCAELSWNTYGDHFSSFIDSSSVELSKKINQPSGGYSQHLQVSEDQSLQSFISWDDSPWRGSSRPYAAVHQAGHFEWTAIDGKQPEVIRFLATDPEMFKRLCQQNSYVTRRQFVYADEEFNQISQEIIQGNRRSIELPSFDGERFSIIVENVDLELSDGISAWNGILEGHPDSTVQASTENGSLIHIDVLYDDCQVRYEARERNEWIINEIDLLALRESNQRITANTSISQVALPSTGVLAAQRR